MATAGSARADDACRVAIDVGHDRRRPGAIGARGVPERTFNEALATRIHRALGRAGIGAFLVADRGDPLDPAARARCAAEGGATLLLSVHHDSVQPRYLEPWTVDGEQRAHGEAFHGFSLFVSGRNRAWRESVEIAAAIADGLLAAGISPTLHHAEPIPGEDRPLLDAARGVYRDDGLAILRHAVIPAVLVEAAVIVNRDDERRAGSVEYQDAVARAVVAAATLHCRRGRPGSR
jgi:N-acetylmuramoyl-L-alanine amidase